MAAPRDRSPFRVPQPGDRVAVRPNSQWWGAFFDPWTPGVVVSSEDYLFQAKLESGEKVLLQLSGEGSVWYRVPSKA